jgi:hypothetical protein
VSKGQLKSESIKKSDVELIESKGEKSQESKYRLRKRELMGMSLLA